MRLGMLGGLLWEAHVGEGELNCCLVVSYL